MDRSVDPALLALVLETIDDAVVVVDEGGRIVLFNAGAAKAFGHEAEQVVGQPLALLLPESAREAHEAHFRAFLSGDEPSRPMALRRTVQARRASGEIFPVAATIVRVDDDRGRLGAAILRDMTEQERARAELLRLSTTDPLTGLANRRSLLERADQEVARAVRHGKALSMLVLDMDHFKAINDHHGHEAGDRILVCLADCLRDELRSTDIAGRLGGEEFALVLPETAAPGAVEVAERIRRAVAERCRIGAAGATVSIGVAGLAPGETVEALLRRADRALYAAKTGGRDRVCAAD